MKIIAGEDRKYLENKYHVVGQPFDAYNRMAYHGYEYDPSTGLSDEEMDRGLAQLSEQIAHLSHQEQKARMVAYVLENTRIDVNPHDYFIGLYSWNRAPSKYTLNRWYPQLVRDHCAEAAETMRRFEDAGMNYGGLDFDHTVPDWDSLMQLGFRGILERAERFHAELKAQGEVTEKQEAFYRGVVIEYRAILDFIARLEQYALAQKHDKAGTVAQCLHRLYEGAPQTTLDALQLIYLYFMISESVDHYQVRSLGFGLDATLYPFYKADLESGRMTEDEFTDYLSYFLMQWSAIGNYWGQPLYLGGTSMDGSTRVNEVSWHVLRVYRALGIYNPKIQIKVGERTPKAFLLEALDMIRSGSNSIVFCCEEHIIRSIMSRGGTYEDGCDAVISGCYEYNKRNRSLNISAVYPNLLKPVLLAMDNGWDRTTDTQLGPRTGEASSFRSFGQFYEAYLAQVRATFTQILDATRQMENISGEINPSLLFSAANPQCVETMTDALDSGIDNDCSLIMGGIGSAVDSLMAVRELVFERGIVTLPELNEALHQNWQGHEKLRRMAVNCPHRYGNGDPMADEYANAIMRFVTVDVIGGRQTAHGGHVIVDGHSARAFIILGAKTPATPDGRLDGEEASKNISPVQGADRKGITALIRSATTISSDCMAAGGCLDAMLHPTAVNGAEGLEAFYSVLMSYVRRKGCSIHFNILDPQQLRDAQEHPEKYPNLQIRVCGWNVLWNNLPRVEQDAYLKRAESIL